jgi:hypothetical protein
MEGLLTGGGERSLGDTGQRGVSLISVVTEGFCGTGAFIVASEEAGWRVGIEAADNALCWAAAEGGFVLVLAERDGLRSWVLFFLDRPGPAVERAEVPVLSAGRFGDDSLEGLGELAVDGVRFGSNFFVGGIEDVDVSRAGFELLAAVWSPAGAAVMSTGSAVCCVAPEIGVKDLSSMMEAVWCSLRGGRRGRSKLESRSHTRMGSSPGFALEPSGQESGAVKEELARVSSRHEGRDEG